LHYTDIGDKEHAFEWLNTAYQEHCLWLIFLRSDPVLAPLRSDPRYAQLVKKVGSRNSDSDRVVCAFTANLN